MILAIFGGIYEYFSHGIYSPYMYGAFLIPLLFIAVDIFIQKILQRLTAQVQVDMRATLSYPLLCMTLTIASIVTGVVAIYGTTNPIVVYYKWFIMALLLGEVYEIIGQVVKRK